MSGPQPRPEAPLDGTLSLFVSNAPVAVALFDRDMRCRAWSQDWASLYGLETFDPAHGGPCEVFPQIPDPLRAMHRRALQGEKIDCEDDRCEGKEGRVVSQRWRIRPILSPDGGVMAVAVFTEDITDRKLAELEVRRVADRMQQITSSLGIGILEHDFATNETMISDGYLALLGITRDEVPGTSDGWTELLRPVDIAVYRAAERRALDPEGDGRLSAEVRPLVNSVEKVMEVQARVEFRGEGEDRVPDRLVGLIVDRTESRLMQDALVRAQRLETVGRLAGMVAHDFNNILTVILANLELADLRAVDTDLRRLLKNAVDAAEMGADFNKRLLALAGGHRTPGRPVVIDAHIAGVWHVFQRVLSDEIGLRFHPGAAGAQVSVGRAEIDGAILNLVMNARDAQPTGGQIEVRTDIATLDVEAAGAIHGGRPGRFLRIAVCDKGTGMPPDVAARLGEPFFTTKAPGRGSGLGLTSVRLTAERAGGFLQVTSVPGQGTEVTIHLPVLEDPARPLAAETGDYPFGNGELVLVVEDDPMVREAVMLRLEAIGYAVIEAGNADAALQQIEAGEPVDLVFSDVVMPGPRSGFDLIRELRARHPWIATLLTSGHVSAAVRERDTLEPPVPLLSKPYPLKALAEAVAAALRQGQTQA